MTLQDHKKHLTAIKKTLARLAESHAAWEEHHDVHSPEYFTGAEYGHTLQDASLRIQDAEEILKEYLTAKGELI